MECNKRCNCDVCLWRDKCDGDEPCDDFTPLEEDVDTYIEQKRAEHFVEWFDYLEECEAEGLFSWHYQHNYMRWW